MEEEKRREMSRLFTCSLVSVLGPTVLNPIFFLWFLYNNGRQRWYISIGVFFCHVIVRALFFLLAQLGAIGFGPAVVLRPEPVEAGPGSEKQGRCRYVRSDQVSEPLLSSPLSL